jgi:ribosomal protein S2
MDPELLLRQSEPIREATWDDTGRSVLFATRTNVTALDLDPRDGRLQTTLATYTSIGDIAVSKKQLLIAGTREDSAAIWALALE